MLRQKNIFGSHNQVWRGLEQYGNSVLRSETAGYIKESVRVGGDRGLFPLQKRYDLAKTVWHEK